MALLAKSELKTFYVNAQNFKRGTKGGDERT
jgi:hypothetical protein